MIRNICSPAALDPGSRSNATAFAVARKLKRVQYLGNDEPNLDDLLSDDVLMRLMARDGVAAEQVRNLADHIRD